VDDTQLFISLLPATYVFKCMQLENRVRNLHLWFCYNCHLLSTDKTECILLSSAQGSHKFEHVSELQVADVPVLLSSTIKTLGVAFDSHLTFDSHIHAIAKSCYYHHRCFHHIRSFIDLETTEAVAYCLNSSRLRCCKSVLYSIF
jgi:hypothetical protein